MKLQHIHDLVVKVPEGILTTKQIMQPLRRGFRRYPWIRFEQRTLKQQEAVGFHDGMLITGCFEHDWCDRPRCVVTLSFYSEKQTKTVFFVGKLRKRILFDIFATIAHERVHLLQSRKAKSCPRRYRVNGSDQAKKMDLQYYGSDIEIDAFAQTSVLEDRFGMKGEIMERYRQLFTPDDWRFKRFLKKKFQYNLQLPNINSTICDISKNI